MSTQELKHLARLNEWKARVKMCRSSGQSVREWCSGNGICIQTYYRWEREVLSEGVCETKRRQAEGIAVREEANFVEITSEDVFSDHVQQRKIAEVETERGKIKIYRGASPEEIKVLCEVALC